MDIKFEFCASTNGHEIVVPLIVSKESLDLSIIGFNVIEEIAKGYTKETIQLSPVL